MSTFFTKLLSFASQSLSAGEKTQAKANLDLQNVDNTSDVNKPVSTAQAAADAAVQAFAIQRGNHTGTQTASTISDFAATAKAAAVADAINDGTTDVAPSQNAVFDALALKPNLSEANIVVSSSRALASTDNGRTLECTASVALTHDITLPVGFKCNVIIVGAFTVTPTNGTGTFINRQGATTFSGDGASGSFILHGTRIIWSADGLD